MMKLHPTTSNVVFSQAGSAKCGEIYCESSNNFTLLCTFCEMKTFDFDDFILHFKNMHFENDLLKTEEIVTEPFIDINVKAESYIENELDSNSDYDNALDDPDWQETEPKRVVQAVNLQAENERLVKEEEFASTSNADSDASNEEEQPPSKRKAKRQRKTREWKCKHCDETYKKQSELKAHLVELHQLETNAEKAQINKAAKTPAELVRCEQCGAEFQSAQRLESHNIKEHGINCTHCEKVFYNKDCYKRHLETFTHNGEKTVKCDYEDCKKAFFTRRRMLSHKRIHYKTKNFICEICGYSCREAPTLRVHVRTHTGEKPFVCTICNKRFVSSSMLREHSASHYVERPHICEVCGATFARQKALYHHKYLHLGIKKFKCKLCDNAYAQASGLAAHMRKHNEGHI